MSNQRILIVEDQADIRKLIRMTLEMPGYELHEADSGDRGYELARALRPRLLLLDVMMPGSMDGLQVCHRLKQDSQYAAIHIVMLTARGQQVDVDAGKAAGANGYLIKPFSPLELMDLADQVLQRPAGG